MDQISPLPDRSTPEPVAAASAQRRASLALVNARFRMALGGEPVPGDWQESLAGLLDWLRIDAEYVPTTRAGRLPRMAGWAVGLGAGEAAVPVFAPWLGWSPAAFQHGGLPGLPAAHFAASYLVDHPRGSALPHRGVDVVLMSPHPSLCVAEDAGGVPLPRAGVLGAMIRAARDEGRERIAIILHARQRNPVAARLLTAGKALTRDGPVVDILTIEDALVPLMTVGTPWDAIIAMPDLRSTVFTLLSHTSGVRCGWPMVWRGGAGASAMTLVTSEVAGEGLTRLALDASALIHALALTLLEAGAHRAAQRLHEGWARLCDSGVTTSGRSSDAPYVTCVEDSRFIAMMRRGESASRRPQPQWRALKNARPTRTGSQIPALRVVV